MAVHAFLLIPIGVLGVRHGAQTDVTRGVSSVELELVTEGSLLPSKGEEAAARVPLPKPEGVTSDDGAISTAKSLGLRNPAPRYPWVARINGWQGTVLLRAGVDPKGEAESVQVARSSGFSVLDAAALTALKQWKFLPARARGGRAVASEVEIPITFKLEKGE